MNKTEALAYLTQCADDNGTHWHGGLAYPLEDCPTCKGSNDAGWLGTPGSRYGRCAADVAPVAYRHARLRARECGEPLTREWLNQSMSLVVNDSDTPETDLREYAVSLAGADVDAMVAGYLECQLWAQIDYDNDGAMLDANYDMSDISEDYVESVRDEIAALVAEHPLAVRIYLATRPNDSFGHDLYLTRESHGAGFWDRGLGDLGDYLTDIAKWAGPADDLMDDGNGGLVA